MLQTLVIFEQVNCINGIHFCFILSLTGTPTSYLLSVGNLVHFCWQKKYQKGQSMDNYIILAINSKYKRRWINVICCRINTILMQCLQYMSIRYKSEERLGEPRLYPSFKPHTHKCTLYALKCFFNIVYLWQRSVWRYQKGNQNPYIEEEQTTQRPNFVRPIVSSEYSLIVFSNPTNHHDQS